MTAHLEQDITIALGVEFGDRVMVAHAHPDDESVATGSTIDLLTQRGIDVYAIIATDGKQSTKGDQDFVGAGKRRSEGQAAYEELGVPRERQYYLDLPDGELSRQSNLQLLTSQVGNLIVQHDITTIMTPGETGFDGHPDHIAVHDAALAAAGILYAQGHNIAVWALQPTCQGEIAIPANPIKKLTALNHHASQFSKLPELRARQLKPYEHFISHPETWTQISLD